MPRFSRWIHPRWITCAALIAAATPAAAVEPPAPPAPRETAIEHLFSERGEPAAFATIIEQARKLEIPDQVVLEARFLYHVDRNDDPGLAALVPEFLARRDSFRPEDSEIFAQREDWLAVVEYVQAVAALQRDDHDAFKRHITEAFWLSPRQGAAFASHIERLRTAEAMRKVRIDFTTSLPPLTGNDPTELSALIHKHKALVLHFWSPWSRECEEFAGDFAATARSLDRHGISVVSLLAENDPRVIADARSFAKPFQDLPCHWLRDHEKTPLHIQLRVQSVPVMVLVAPDGRILYNGHPADPECWKALQQIAPELERPAAPKADDAP